MSDQIVIVGGEDVVSLLRDREPEVVDAVARAYIAHDRGESALPHSSFLRFPERKRSRIISLPAYLGDGFDLAGIKWISSFPRNLERGIARASAVLVLNDLETGRPIAVLEGSVISAQRTAASAALAARELCAEPGPETLGIVGAGLINAEIARFLCITVPSLRTVRVYDKSIDRSRKFGQRVGKPAEGLELEAVETLEEVLAGCPLVSFATTAVEPHVSSLEPCPPRTVILHVSLRDLSADAILGVDNVVDDLDHVCRESTSIHLAAEKAGHRRFVRCSLADLLNGEGGKKVDSAAATVFSPFGLGVLDLAVGELVLGQALAEGRGTVVPGFFPG